MKTKEQLQDAVKAYAESIGKSDLFNKEKVTIDFLCEVYVQGFSAAEERSKVLVEALESIANPSWGNIDPAKHSERSIEEAKSALQKYRGTT